MIQHNFPDLAWLKQKIASGFPSQPGQGIKPIPTAGCSKVIINAKTTAIYRPQVKGLFSIFCNLSGESLCKVNHHTFRIRPGQYFVSNQEQEYTLTIEAPEPTETFNIHLGEQLATEVLDGLVRPAHKIIEQGGRSASIDKVEFLNKLYPQDPNFQQIIREIYQCHKAGLADALYMEEQYFRLMICLLQAHYQVMKEVEKLPSIRTATKVELYKRLSYALDYLHSQEGGNLNLEEMAGVACLSKFHFLRLFKLAFKLSPYQYQQKIRLDKAMSLLRNTRIPVQEVAHMLGFENANSFSRLFYQRLKVYPSQFREAS